MTIETEYLVGQVSYTDLSLILKRQILAETRPAKENIKVRMQLSSRSKEVSVLPPYPSKEAEA